MTLGEFLKQARKSKKIKLVKFAAEMGTTPSSISRFENSQTAPSITQVEKLFDFVGYRLLPVDKNILPKL